VTIAQWLLEHITPGYNASRERLAHAMEQNSKANDLLTEEMKRAAYRPDQTMRLRVGEWNEKK
jgi:hypothetical protein